MKKITFLFVLCFAAAALQARTVDVSASYTGAKHFDQVQAGATVALSLTTFAGVEAKLANERAFKDPIYSLATPISLELEQIRFVLRPFYYFKNKSDQPALQDSSAFGVNALMRVTLEGDEVEDNYTYSFLGASFARQKGTVFYDTDPAANRYYSQAAFTLGLAKTLYNAFGFDLVGTLFQYPDRVSGVTALHGVMNQQELAQMQTLDIVHELPKYTLATRMSRIWTDNGSTAYISYRYGEYHTAKPEHSIMVGNSFTAFGRVSVDVAYNHVRDVHNDNRRDIGYVRISTYF